MKIIVTPVSNGFLLEPYRPGNAMLDSYGRVVEGDDPKKLGDAILTMLQSEKNEAAERGR